MGSDGGFSAGSRIELEPERTVVRRRAEGHVGELEYRWGTCSRISRIGKMMKKIEALKQKIQVYYEENAPVSYLIEEFIRKTDDVKNRGCGNVILVFVLSDKNGLTAISG